MFVKRDRDTDDGGKKGEITTNPKEVDAIVKRAWKAVSPISSVIHKKMAAPANAPANYPARIRMTITRFFRYSKLFT